MHPSTGWPEAAAGDSFLMKMDVLGQTCYSSSLGSSTLCYDTQSDHNYSLGCVKSVFGLGISTYFSEIAPNVPGLL